MNRISRDSIGIDNSSVPVMGGIQPDVIKKIAAEPYGDGSLQHMLARATVRELMSK